MSAAVSQRAHLVFKRRTGVHPKHCKICHCECADPACVAVQFSGTEPPEVAEVFCVECIDDLTMARHYDDRSRTR